ncbi:TetR/AcrR family transcriptional regulator [Streptomyces sp. NBC_01803]|uniref:TetR/AcrR family transcriptional regulator n=1 Tax=Streptomyces sp. NBC_01803 TaxID=2975946 RepID=UPI002DD9AB35|nr:TetR/AcrR family transcriptional regulator C-terminal domain-containing protein [Streptomyces sp. NBC_01803]WSA44570.1 TetR/AcrR family transcriptional regulator C-terminal domain-containing protein [Streptomyces sp. NBC_01803]
MPRPKSLTQSQVTDAALAVIDRDGLAALSMRVVAAELGMATMSLYRYVAGRDELESLVAERMLAAVDVVPPPGEPWQEQVAVLLARLRAAVAAHPEAMPLVLTHRHDSPGAWRWAEAVLSVLRAAGFTGRQRLIGLRGLISYLIGALQTDRLGPPSGAAGGDDYPLLADVVRHAKDLSPDVEFRNGIDLLLSGLAGHLA